MRKDCCSIPHLGIETLEKWRELFNEACCYHDDMYSGAVYAKSRAEADERFYSALIAVARQYEDRYGYMGYTAAHDMYVAVRSFGWKAWRLSTFKRWRNRYVRW